MDNKKFIRVNGKTRATRLYNIWVLMRSRCRCKTNKDYDRYGGRGIFVCPDWQDFYTFHTWAKDNGYRGNLSLDRRNNDDGYYPSNCRWADKWTQIDNRDCTIFFTYQEEERTLRHWAKTSGQKYNSLYKRIFVYGWPFEYALEAPLGSPAPTDAKPKPKPKPVAPHRYGF